MEGLVVFGREEMYRSFVLVYPNFPCQDEAQDSALSIDVCRLFSMLITSDKAALRANMKLMRASSANSSVEISPTASVGLVVVWSTRSLIKTRKRIGPRCEPWGTPAVILCGAETVWASSCWTEPADYPQPNLGACGCRSSRCREDTETVKV